ncbi:SGNH/GDSL hydrolase family protein [Bacillus sp. FJAT-50079]|uniref:SGNH/GDSL hydrolase family protein n=1 Tax=Bacillus sp. FJAT-50079 TaxID=2833577 RepID=UPI001BC908FD|nr:SGNH/GDSL hydrolase family protein [Bacillus sp. FJAT-50079]MBS4209840.1 SGNH/GDSL hydrolase family protein [Bacillus sp. FJAT-50079]
MKRLMILLLLLVLALMSCSASNVNVQLKPRTTTGLLKPFPPEDFIPKNISIVSVGDSLTQGVGDDQHLGGYISYLKEELEDSKGIKTASFVNYGVKGNRSGQLLTRLKKKEMVQAIEEADLVIITIGGNDVMQVFKENLLGLEVSQFAAAETGYSKRLKEIIETIRSYNNEARIALVGIYNPFMKYFSDIKEMDDIVMNWNKTSESIVTEFNDTSFIPVADIFENNEENLLYSDLFHPNNRGYQLMAERIYEYLEKDQMLQGRK